MFEEYRALLEGLTIDDLDEGVVTPDRWGACPALQTLRPAERTAYCNWLSESEGLEPCYELAGCVRWPGAPLPPPARRLAA